MLVGACEHIENRVRDCYDPRKDAVVSRNDEYSLFQETEILIPTLFGISLPFQLFRMS